MGLITSNKIGGTKVNFLSKMLPSILQDWCHHIHLQLPFSRPNPQTTQTIIKVDSLVAIWVGSFYHFIKRNVAIKFCKLDFTKSNCCNFPFEQTMQHNYLMDLLATIKIGGTKVNSL